MRIDPFQRQNMFLGTINVICHGDQIAHSYPLLGDFTAEAFDMIRKICWLRGVNPDHVTRALFALTGFHLEHPDQETAEAFAEAKVILAANPHKTTQESWPNWYVSTRYPTSDRSVPPGTLSLHLDART